MNKLIVIDSGFMTHRTIFAWGAEKKRLLEQGKEEDPIPVSYGYLNSFYSILKRVGYDKDDRVLVANDGWNAWRKAFLTEYKGQRKGLRDDRTEIDWKLHYGIINKLEKQLNDSTDWEFLQLNNMVNFADLCLTEEGKKFNIEGYDIEYSKEYGLEADDIMAVVPKVFPNHEVILVTIDQDISQCYYYDNVKIFNPNLVSATNKAKKGFYVYEKDPLGVIQKKVRSGDSGDNILVDKRNDTERDVEIRELIINLLNLPQWVEEPIVHELKNIKWDKKVCYEKLPFQNSLAKKFDTIYSKKDVRTWEESVKRHELKEEQKKAKARERSKKKREENKKEKAGV